MQIMQQWMVFDSYATFVELELILSETKCAQNGSCVCHFISQVLW